MLLDGWSSKGAAVGTEAELQQQQQRAELQLQRAEEAGKIHEGH